MRDSMEERLFVRSALHFRYELGIVGEAPDGCLLPTAGVRQIPEPLIGYNEPLAADLPCRRKELGTAAVLKDFRRAAYRERKAASSKEAE